MSFVLKKLQIAANDPKKRGAALSSEEAAEILKLIEKKDGGTKEEGAVQA